MSRPLAVLRPEPGATATVRRIEALGCSAIRLPLFAVRPLAWEVPNPAGFDALFLTSANTLRHAGPGLDRLAGLPVHAVGEATAQAARDAGLTVVAVGDADGGALFADAARAGVAAGLLLGGRDRAYHPHPVVAHSVAVYASETLPVSPAAAAGLSGTVALVHSPRAGARLAEVIAAHGIDPSGIALAAISAAAADAAGLGWRAVAVAGRPSDAEVVAAAIRLAD